MEGFSTPWCGAAPRQGLTLALAFSWRALRLSLWGPLGLKAGTAWCRLQVDGGAYDQFPEFMDGWVGASWLDGRKEFFVLRTEMGNFVLCL